MESKKPKRLSVSIEGDVFYWHSLAHVNRELALALFDKDINVGLRPRSAVSSTETKAFSRHKDLAKVIKQSSKPDIVIRHAFPPDLSVPQYSTVVMQPWEFLGAPEEWINGFGQFREVWVNSNFTKNVYVNCGLNPATIQVLPLGVDTKVFYPLPAPKKRDDTIRFLYVGGTIERKGIDVLLQAFLQEFGREQDVELVIKDTGTKHVYSKNHHGARIRKLINDRARIRYVDDDLSLADLAALYATATCLVQPYRGEGFCLPVLEAMACGIPAIVTSGGPTDDFVLQDTGWRIASRQVVIEQLPGLTSKFGQGWLEPSLEDLQATMREIYERPQVASEKGRRAEELVKSHWDWAVVADKYLSRLRDLAEPHKSSVRGAKGTTISLCMIVRDEERVLEQALVSAQPFFDEIIVVDTGSTDRTKEIAMKYASKVVDFEWVDSFAAARNESLKHATSDWIFWMDADDTLPPGSGAEIRRAAASAPSGIDGFIVPVQFVEMDGSFGTRVDHVKLFRNKPGIQFEGRIHEQILGSLCMDGSAVARCGALVLHSGYDNSVEGQQKKKERDFKLLELDIRDRPNHPFVMFNFGMTHFYAGDPKLAVKWLKKCVKLSKTEESHRRKAWVLLALSLAKIGKRDEAVQVLKDAYAEYPDDAEIPFQLGCLLRDQKLFDAAKSYFVEVLSKKPSTYLSSVDVGIYNYKTLHNIGSIEHELDNFDEAKHWYKSALATAPHDIESAKSLAEISIITREWDTAKLGMEHIRVAQGESLPFAELFAKYQEARYGLDAAVRATRQNMVDNPQSQTWRLVHARTLLSSGDVASAMPILEGLVIDGVAEAAYCLGICHIQLGQLEQALAWMQRANELNPSHEQTLNQISGLMTAIRGNK